MSLDQVTVFGGTGFLGRRIARAFVDLGHVVRVASRHLDPAGCRADPTGNRLQFIHGDVCNQDSVAAAVEGSAIVVNAISLYRETGSLSFRAIHVEAAARVARLAREAGAEKLFHISGIGADAASTSPYVRSRGEGEMAVRQAFPAATLIRPAVMFGENDALVVPLARILRRAPVFALFGRGATRLQPVHVGDVAAAVARATDAPRPIYEFGGPRVLSYRALIELICRALGRSPLLVPLPFAAWSSLAFLAERLPRAPITRDQVELMRHDNVASADQPGLANLVIAPTSLEETLPHILEPLSRPPR